MSVTTQVKSSFCVDCDMNGLATDCSQVTMTQYLMNGDLVGQSSVMTALTLSQLQTIVAALQSE